MNAPNSHDEPAACDPHPEMKTHRVVVLALPGVLPFDVAAASHAFSNLNGLSGRYRVSVVSETSGVVPTADGYAIRVEHDLRAFGTADTVIVAGVAPPPRVLADTVIHVLRQRFADGVRVVGVGTGVFPLALAGILTGRRVTTHWRYATQFQRAFPRVHLDPDVLYVQDQALFTSAGLAAGIDLFVELIRQDHGVEAANAAARAAVMSPPRSGHNVQFLDRPLPLRATSGLAPVRAWMLENLGDEMTVDGLAARAFMSRRQFTRVFRAETGTSAWQWLLEARLREACRLLETTAEPVELIGQLCGFSTAASFRMHFRRAHGTTPSEYRVRMRAAAGNRDSRSDIESDALPLVSVAS